MRSEKRSSGMKNMALERLWRWTKVEALSQQSRSIKGTLSSSIEETYSHRHQQLDVKLITKSSLTLAVSCSRSCTAANNCGRLQFTSYVVQPYIFSIDSTRESSHVGRLLNHSRLEPNLIPKIFVDDDETAHVIFNALHNIQPGVELLYDYGDRGKNSVKNHPWLMNT